MVEAYLAILAGCITGVPTAPAAVHQQELRARLMRILEVRLPDPSLSPSEVASTLGISTRHLHRLFAGTGSTFGAWVRELRLERCHDDLLDSHLQHRTITEIAFAWGFSDSAHFSRSFKQRYGVAPQMFRASHVKNGRFALGQVSPKRLRMVACDSGT
jgi:AraC-like DNA-binding protein